MAEVFDLDVGLERLGVGLDRREGVVVHRDHRRGADQLGRDDGVVAVHRVVAADRQQGDVDRRALGDQLHVAEQAGVAGVVDGRPADVDHQPGGLADRDAVLGAERRLRRSPGSCSCGRPARASPSPSRTRPCRRGWGRETSSTPRSLEPVGDLDDRHAVARPVRLATGDRVGDVVGVAVGDEDRGSAPPRRRSRPRPGCSASGTGRPAPAPSPSLSSKQAWPRKRISICSVLLVRSSRLQLLGQRPADGDADHHPHPRLLGEQGAHRGQPLLLAGRRLGRLADLAPRAPRRTSRPPRAPAASTRCSFGAAAATTDSASRKRSGSVSASIAASSSSSL